MTPNLLSRVFAKMWPTDEELPTLKWFSYNTRLADYFSTNISPYLVKNCENFSKRHSREGWWGYESNLSVYDSR